MPEVIVEIAKTQDLPAVPAAHQQNTKYHKNNDLQRRLSSASCFLHPAFCTQKVSYCMNVLS